MGRHRETRPRYRRISVALTAALVTAIAILGGTGLLPTETTPASVAAANTVEAALPADAGGSRGSAEDLGSAGPETGREPGSVPVDGRSDASVNAPADAQLRSTSSDLPTDSGHGKRVVFSIERQRVWLVGANDNVARSYLVSGSLTDNLKAGEYAVSSKSPSAVGVDDSGVMRYMVRFAHGKRAAIGFHDIPTNNGQFLQTRKQLGTPQSHGCIRQWRPDARALWAFAPVGTKVVVLA